MKVIEAIYAKVFPGSRESAVREILSASDANPFVRVGFAYFAQLEMLSAFSSDRPSADVTSLLEQDFLLGDGIALRLLHYAWKHPETPRLLLVPGYRYFARRSVENLNGTDFLPFFLDSLSNPSSCRLVLYGTYPEYVEKAAAFARERFGMETVFQNGYEPFDPSLLSSEKTNVLLLGLPSPMAERFAASLGGSVSGKKVVSFGVGGLLDFWGWRERRAPGFVRALALEWLWRAVTNPGKNLRKTLVSFKFFWYVLFPR